MFFDVVSAFATLLRRIVFDVDQGDEAWFRKLHDAGFSSDDVELIYAHIRNYAWSQGFQGDARATANGLTFKLAEQWYINTWASHEFIPNVISTTAGSGAGTPLADLVYSLAMARVLTTVRRSLDHDVERLTHL